MNFNLGPLWQVVLPLAATALTVIAGWVAKRAMAFLKIKQGSMAQDDLDQALWHADNLVLDWVKTQAADQTTFKVPASVLAYAADMALRLAPNAAKALDVTPSHLALLLQARLNAWGATQTAPQPVTNVHVGNSALSDAQLQQIAAHFFPDKSADADTDAAQPTISIAAPIAIPLSGAAAIAAPATGDA